MQDDRVYDGGGAFWVGFGLIAGALIVGALCAQQGDAARLDDLPGQATSEQIEASVVELEELMLEEGFEPEQIEPVLRRFRCKYLPDTEGCDEESPR